MTNKVAIIGGGYVGIQLAKELENKADITLIEPRSHFAHAPALIRSVVDPTVLDQALIPYDKLLNRGKLVQAKAQSVTEKGVTLEDGTFIEANYIVIATGSENATPFKPKGADISAFRSISAEVHMRLVAAKTVAIVGAGAVGVELAGEIAHFMPEKDVTLISADIKMFPNNSDKLGIQLKKKLVKAGVKIITGARAENLESLTEPYSGSLKLSTGTQVSADLIFPVIGSRACSALLEDLPDTEQTKSARYKVDKWMRPSSLPNVFAAGDVADAGSPMTIVAISGQLQWLSKTLKALVKGNKVENLKPYKPASKAPILVPLGPRKGNSDMVLFVAGDWLTSFIKGKDLFITTYRKALGRES